MARPASRFERRTALILLLAAVICISFLIDRHSRLNVSSLRTGLYLQAPEIFDAGSVMLDDQENELQHGWDAGSSLDASGHVWLGSSHEAVSRGRITTPGRDVFGQLTDFNGPRIVYEQAFPAASLPGGSPQQRSRAAMLRMVPEPSSHRYQLQLQQASSVSQSAIVFFYPFRRVMASISHLSES